MGYMANGDIAKLCRIGGYEERYGLHFADAVLSFPDYDDEQVNAKVCLDTLESESASLSAQQQNALYRGVDEDYAIRVSLDYSNTREEIDYFMECIKEAIKEYGA